MGKATEEDDWSLTSVYTDKYTHTRVHTYTAHAKNITNKIVLRIIINHESMVTQNIIVFQAHMKQSLK